MMSSKDAAEQQSVIAEKLMEILVERFKARILASDGLSVDDVALMLGVSVATVKRWNGEGKLRCHRTGGGHRRFKLQEVAAALQAGRVHFGIHRADDHPVQVIGVDLAAKPGDATAVSVVEHNSDGSMNLVSSRTYPAAAVAEDENLEQES